MKTIPVNTKSKYDILLGKGIFENIPRILFPVCRGKTVLIITDGNVDKIYGARLLISLKSAGYSAYKYVIKSGEQSKNADTLFEILEFTAQNGLKRDSIILSLGGGVVGDIAGLAAALYMRGISLVQIPTTLLSAVDSSVGGKTAVNLSSGKNLAGVFYEPSLVIIDSEIIKNLPDDTFGEGLGEVIKYGVIKNPHIIDILESGKVKENLQIIIEKCLLIKRNIVERDEFDTLGIRNALNAGHTIAHAIELLSGYTVPHGIAVANGLVTESLIAQKLKICDEKTAQRIEKCVKNCGLLREFSFDKQKIIDACTADKKNKGNKISFLLPESLGKTKEVTVLPRELKDLL